MEKKKKNQYIYTMAHQLVTEKNKLLIYTENMNLKIRILSERRQTRKTDTAHNSAHFKLQRKLF